MIQRIDARHYGDNFLAYHGDCCEALKLVGAESVGLSVFSPPFAELYTYSDDIRDLGNSRNFDEFFEHFGYVVSELARVMMPGRIVAVHCIDIPSMKERDGVIGLKDFPGEIIRLFQRHGFVYHSRHVIWKDPLVEATRTKALGLAHKQLMKDSAMSRAGLPDYLIAMRKPGDNPKPVTHPKGLERFIGDDAPPKKGDITDSHQRWRRYASPVWMDVNQSRTLNREPARGEKDEKHICPLQLDVIERAVELWSAEGDVVLSPFMGIGSEGYVSVLNGRQFIGVELKREYFEVAVKNLEKAEIEKLELHRDLFTGIGVSQEVNQ